MIIGGLGGRGGENIQWTSWGNEVVERGSAYENDSLGALLPGSGGGGGAVTNGGSGVVILRMLTSQYSGTTTGSPTVATGVSGQTVITFTGSGSYTA